MRREGEDDDARIEDFELVSARRALRLVKARLGRAGHPEHHSIHHEASGRVDVVETLGEHVCSMFLTPWDDSEISAAGPRPPAGASTSARRTRLALADGTVLGSVSTAFEPADGGFLARLTVTLPQTCAPMVAQHLEHFAVELHTWILRAASEQGSSAQRFAAEGAVVAVGGRDTTRGAAVVAEITGAGGRAVFVPADLDGTRATSFDIAERATQALGGRLDVLVSNAAVVHVAATAQTDEAQMAQALAVNVTGPFFLVAALAPAMAARGSGAVITISSWDDPDDPAWSCVVGTPLGRTVRPGEIAAAAAYLASEDAASVHGIRLDVDGGRTATAVIAG